ncbi:MAG TPA: hypothetical protein DHW81_01515 [Nitrospiraceae bacterium]|nr:MAG: hypothetical protein A2Z82_02580 [Nitrospirae bacterium GWA2_46_11]OGW23117.1 MAG: hypothetical protein A2X55_09080 [Nitrospirae bacterium GWB2_47_37]HAK87664.1 hypothetical protein [Nitrospiraceae bacterium]HCL80939.1 hypothetical protein [Nitrospiraceae bacterium]
MDIKEFKKAVYHAVRECENADRRNSDGFIDQQNDYIIRQAIEFIENTPSDRWPEMCEVEIVSLAECSRRRIYMSFLVKK